MQMFPRKTINPVDEKTGPTNVVLGLVTVVKDLVQLMNKEIELIETRKMKEHADLLKLKQRMTMDYRASMKNLALNPDMLKHVPEHVKQSAREAAMALAAATERNAKMLRTAILAAQRLVQSIVAIVKSEVMPKAGYRNTNSAQSAPGAYSPICKPVAVRRTA